MSRQYILSTRITNDCYSERKIDDMQDRLAGIESLLQKLTTSNTSVGATQGPTASVLTARASVGSTPGSGTKPTPPFAGAHDDISRSEEHTLNSSHSGESRMPSSA